MIERRAEQIWQTLGVFAALCIVDVIVAVCVGVRNSRWVNENAYESFLVGVMLLGMLVILSAALLLIMIWKKDRESGESYGE